MEAAVIFALVMGNLLFMALGAISLLVAFKANTKWLKISAWVVYGIAVILSYGLALLMLPYFAPAIIAIRKNHPSWLAICALNWFAFTIILWIVALVWALSNPREVVIVRESEAG